MDCPLYGNEMWKNLGHRTYRAVDYPEFDICKAPLPEQFDIVIADQVLEHVSAPVTAVSHVRAMVKRGGAALIATPFLFRVHARPHDYSRWTESGLKELLIAGGFDAALMSTGSWGNKACAKAHIGGRVKDYGFRRDMSNDPEYPIMVWAIATT